jgi:hypothetical protein
MALEQALNGHTGHLTADLGTLAAGFCAGLAMLRREFFAFDGASIANLCTKPAKLFQKPRSAAHEGRRLPTKLGTVPVEPNALGHLSDVGFG